MPPSDALCRAAMTKFDVLVDMLQIKSTYITLHMKVVFRVVSLRQEHLIFMSASTGALNVCIHCSNYVQRHVSGIIFVILFLSNRLRLFFHMP